MSDHDLGNLLAVPFMVFLFLPYIVLFVLVARRLYEILRGKW